MNSDERIDALNDRIRRAIAAVPVLENAAFAYGLHDGECRNGLAVCKRCQNAEVRVKEARNTLLSILAP